MRSVSGLPDNDLDRATYLGNDADTSHSHELNQAETIAAVRDVTARLVARFNLAECSSKRCRHGINLEAARCCTCAPLTPHELETTR